MTRPAFRIGTQVFFLTRLGKLYRAEHCLPKMPAQINKGGNHMEFLWESLLSITWQQPVMYVVGGLLIWLAIEKGFEPALLLPMGF